MQADSLLYLSELIPPFPLTDYYIITLAPHPPDCRLLPHMGQPYPFLYAPPA